MLTPSGAACESPAAGPYLTVRDVAKRLGVCRATVYEICARGELRHARALNAIRIPQDALVHFLKKQGEKGRPRSPGERG